MLAPAAAQPRRRFGDPRLLMAIFAGGIVGALARAAIGELAPTGAGAFPWTVLAINVGGAMFLAYVVVRLQERLPPSTYRRPFVGTGLCGALTTFSTMQVQAATLAKDGHVALAVAYLAVSVVAGAVGVVLAVAVTRRARLR